MMVVVVGCSKDTPETSRDAEAKPQVASNPTPEPVSPVDKKLIADAIVEKAIRKSLKKPEGELTEADLGNVIELILADTQITDEGLKEMAKLQRLETLQLSYTRITDAGIKELAKSQQLGTLFLTDTQITDAGLKDVTKLHKLKMLRISGTKVTKAGVTELKEALPNCKIYGP